MKKLLIAACALAALSACNKPAVTKTESTTTTTVAAAPTLAPGLPAPLPTKAPAGTYRWDASHSTVTFRLHHLGFSRYTGQFTRADATLTFDPANPGAMAVEATIDPKSLSIPSPPAGFTEELLGKGWLDAGQFPAITFKSTRVETTGATTARVTGDFTLHGVTKPVVLDVTFNGGYAPFQLDPGGRVGFSAHTTIRRSDFGIAAGIPAAGSNLGVGDEIDVAIEAEFSQDVAKPAA